MAEQAETVGVAVEVVRDYGEPTLPVESPLGGTPPRVVDTPALGEPPASGLPSGNAVGHAEVPRRLLLNNGLYEMRALIEVRRMVDEAYIQQAQAGAPTGALVLDTATLYEALGAPLPMVPDPEPEEPGEQGLGLMDEPDGSA